MGGMGKTALATEAAHWWTRSGLFRDGACFLSFEQFASAERAVQVLGTYVEGIRFEQLPAAEQRRRAIEIFQQKEVLMVWDNFESALPQFNDGAATQGSPYIDDERRRLADLFRDLTTGPGKGCLLVTCRPGETGLPGAQRYELHGLARADSLWLLSHILERNGLNFSDSRLSRDKLDPLLRDLGDHPLSLELVGPHLRTLTPEEIRADFSNLLVKFKQEAPEERNQSLLASLEFSRRHLSPAAREALPWIGLFSGGVLESNLLGVSQLTPEAWEPIRRELEDVALLRTEVDGFFLRFHPTLASAAASSNPNLAKNPEIRQRFIDAYLALMHALDNALTGSQSRGALEILSREEANYRTAVQWAVADQQLPSAAGLGSTLRDYLERSGRFRERDAWVQWLKDVMVKDGFTAETAVYEREHAWTRFTQGDPKGAVDQLQNLIERLRQATEFDPAMQLVIALGTLGRVLRETGASAQAIPILRESVSLCEMAAEKAGGQPWEMLLASPDYTKGASELRNLSTAMGDLSNALRNEGHHGEALSVAEKSLEISERMGNHREIAAGHSQCASILSAERRYHEADSRYDLALSAARQVGDKELVGKILQHQGALVDNQGQLERASHIYQQALQYFQEAGERRSVMLTYNLLGVTEAKAGRLAEARAWFEGSRELALELQDQNCLGQAAQNIGITWRDEGDAARGRGEEVLARQHFEEALRFGNESLRIKQRYISKPDEASAWSSLAQIHFRLGDLAYAEDHAHEARKIRESLDLKEVCKDYDNLSEIARARGNLDAAAEWAKKRDDLLHELESRGGGGVRLTAQLFKTLQALTRTCAKAGFEDGGFGPEGDEALGQMAELPVPFSGYVAFLRQIAQGQLPPIPDGLPGEFREWLEELVQAIRKASQ